MTGPTTPGPGSRGREARGQESKGQESRDLWPRDFGRDGVSGLVTPARAMRARDVSRPDADDVEHAERVVADLLARIEGRVRSR